MSWISTKGCICRPFLLCTRFHFFRSRWRSASLLKSVLKKAFVWVITGCSVFYSVRENILLGDRFFRKTSRTVLFSKSNQMLLWYFDPTVIIFVDETKNLGWSIQKPGYNNNTAPTYPMNRLGIVIWSSPPKPGLKRIRNKPVVVEWATILDDAVYTC